MCRPWGRFVLRCGRGLTVPPFRITAFGDDVDRLVGSVVTDYGSLAQERIAESRRALIGSYERHPRFTQECPAFADIPRQAGRNLT
jgi:hypothetical protein